MLAQAGVQTATHAIGEHVLDTLALTAPQALHGYTVAPTLAASAEHVARRIAARNRADLTAFAASPLDTPAADLPGLPGHPYRRRRDHPAPRLAGPRSAMLPRTARTP